MSKVSKLEPLVHSILKNNEQTRGDDFILVYEVYKNIFPNIDNIRFSNIILNHREYGLPYFESVTRVRRKLQSKYSELLPNKKIVEAREKEELDYIDYSREK